MPSDSEKQRRAAAAALAAKRRRKRIDQLEGPALRMFRTMTRGELEDFAKKQDSG